MKPALVVTIPGDPVGAARPRFSRGKPPTRVSLERLSRSQLIQRLMRPGLVHTYLPDNHKNWEALATKEALQAMRGARVLAFSPQGRQPLTGAVGVSMLAIHKRPGRLRRKSDPRERMPFLKKPDADNTAKLPLDAFTKAGVWSDDALVFRLRVDQWYQRIGPHIPGKKPLNAEGTRVIVSVYDLDGVTWSEPRPTPPTLDEIAAFVASLAPPGQSITRANTLGIADSIRRWRPGA